MIFYYLLITLCMTSIVQCADNQAKLKSPGTARVQLENKEEKKRIQTKKNSAKSAEKYSLHSLRGSSDEVLDRFMGDDFDHEAALDRLMAKR